MNTWDDLEKLEANWDSYKADPITPAAIATGKMLEQVLATHYSSLQRFPSADGGVGLEDDDTYISIGPDGQIDGLLGGCND